MNHHFTKLPPKIYKIVEKTGKDAKGYDLVEIGEKYSIKQKLYGIINKLIPRVVRLIEKKLFNHISIIATGGKGLGKTTSMNKLSNLLLEANIPVIEVKFIPFTLELVDFLSDFRNVAFHIDEFAKTVDKEIQDKMLVLLNRKDDYYSIFILGDNDIRTISQYILDRMERAKYHMHLSRISNEDLKEYAKDNNLSKDILDNLLAINKVNSKISYDTLDALKVESRIFPELSFSELVEVMNIKGIIGIPILNTLDISIESDIWYVDSYSPGYSSDKIKYSDFMENSYTYIRFKVILKKLPSVLEKEKEEREKHMEQHTSFPMTPNPIGFGGADNPNGNTITLFPQFAKEDIVSIDDSEGIITIEKVDGDYKYKAVFNTRIINID